MLDECLQEQKQEKMKYIKACKRAKQELQAARDNDLSQMLSDLESTCAKLEQDQQSLSKALEQEREKVHKSMQLLTRVCVIAQWHLTGVQVEQHKIERDVLLGETEKTQNEVAEWKGTPLHDLLAIHGLIADFGAG